VVGRLEAAGVPVSPYRDLRAALTDPQLHHRGMITELVDAAGPLQVPNTPMRFSATEASIKPWVATLGQHTNGVLRELGHSEEAIATLRSEAVIR